MGKSENPPPPPQKVLVLSKQDLGKQHRYSEQVKGFSKPLKRLVSAPQHNNAYQSHVLQVRNKKQ